MSNAGYGNHDAEKPGSAAAAVEGRERSPRSSTASHERATQGGDARRADPSMPREGASSKGSQGDEVDPGAG